MEMEHITGTAYGLVMRQGIEAGRAGNTGRHGMRKAGRSRNGAAPQVIADAPREEIGGHQTDVGPSPERHRPVLRVVSSKYLGTAQPTRMPRAAVSKYPLLVFSR